MTDYNYITIMCTDCGEEQVSDPTELRWDHLTQCDPGTVVGWYECDRCGCQTEHRRVD